jgi:hypothetical protein
MARQIEEYDTLLAFGFGIQGLVNGGADGVCGRGLSALMLYQKRGKSVSFSKNLVWSDMIFSFKVKLPKNINKQQQ